MKVDVYRNLTKGGYSIKNRSTGLVESVEDTVSVKGAQFVVQSAGREKVREEERKNVHAFVRGTLSEDHLSNGQSVYYDPYEYDTFVAGDEEIHEAEHVTLSPDGVVAVP